MTSIERRRTMSAPPEQVWRVLADFGALSSAVPMIQHSCLLSEQTEGVGTVRRVQIARQTLVERVVEWDPPYTLAYELEGLPPIVGVGRNTWRLTAAGSGTEAVLTTEIDTGRNPAKALIARRVLDRMATASEFLLAGIDEASSVRPATVTSDTNETREETAP